MKRFPVKWVAVALFIGWFVGNNKSDEPPIPVQNRVEIVQPNKPVTTAIIKAPVKKQQPKIIEVALPKIKTVPKNTVAILPNTKITAKQNPTNLLKPQVQTLYVDADRLNVRKGPGTSHKTIWTLKRDQAVSVTKTSGDWSYVSGNRFKGWVHGGYLTNNKKQIKTVSIQKPIIVKPVRLKPKISDKEIIKILIRRSLGLYSGRCPCPYNTTSRGSRCGGRSAYSRPGGASPLCYSRDISKYMIAEYRDRM